MHSIEERLERLKNEYKDGQQQLQVLLIRQKELDQTLLRISGAIQILEEIKAEQKENAMETQ